MAFMITAAAGNYARFDKHELIGADMEPLPKFMIIDTMNIKSIHEDVQREAFRMGIYWSFGGSASFIDDRSRYIYMLRASHSHLARAMYQSNNGNSTDSNFKDFVRLKANDFLAMAEGQR